MTTKLISITKPVADDLKHFNSEELISYIARVSNPSNQMNTATASKLLKYCIKNKHWSVFEHVNITFEITTSLAIATQILRHRSFKFQQFSMRYSKSELEFEPIEFRLQDKKNRQNSIEYEIQNKELPNFRDFKLTKFSHMIEELQEKTVNLYNDMLDFGIAKEVARFILPTCTQTTLYMTGDLRSWLHYIELRADKSTQKEHRMIAIDIKEKLIKEFPNIFGVEQ
jgi:thymidylate synthase (FAD)